MKLTGGAASERYLRPHSFFGEYLQEQGMRDAAGYGISEIE